MNQPQSMGEPLVRPTQRQGSGEGLLGDRGHGLVFGKCLQHGNGLLV